MIAKLAEIGKHRQWCISQDPSGVLMAQCPSSPIVWMAPEQVHQDFTHMAHRVGNFGLGKTVTRLLKIVWWPGIVKDTQNFINTCIVCATNNADLQVKKGPLSHCRIIGLRHTIQIDFIGPLPVTQYDNRYRLVIVDTFTKWVEAYPLRSCTAMATTKALIL